MDVIMLGYGWFSQNGLDQGRHHGWAMDALFSKRIRPWMSSYLGHGCSLLKTGSTMRVIMVWLWMLTSQNGSDHGQHGCAMDAV